MRTALLPFRPAGDQPVVKAVSSRTNDVCSELSSVPVNFSVDRLPAYERH